MKVKILWCYELAPFLVTQVIAACGSDEKCQVTKNKGAFEAINYNKESLKECVQEITDGSGVNVVFDCVGGKLFRECVSR